MENMNKGTWNSTSIIAWISLFVALLGGVPGVISIKNDLFKTSINISYDKNVSFLALLASDRKDLFGKKVIGFWGLKFVGTGEAPTTVRSIQLYIKVDGEWVEGKRVDLHSNQVGGVKEPCLVIGGSKGNLIIEDWVNFKDYVGEYYIERGKTLPFNVAFVFDIPENDILTSKKWKFIITDHLSKKYSTTINSPEYVSFISNNLLVFDCHLKKPDEVQELLKDSHLDYNKLHEFLRQRNNSK